MINICVVLSNTNCWTVRNNFKGAMQRVIDDLILASPIIQNFWQQTFFFLLAAKNSRILLKNECERKLLYMVNEKDTQ